jgi:hypothetical protein
VRVAVISNLLDGKGLARDAVILEKLLEKWGHEARLIDFRHVDRRDYHYTVVVHLELVSPLALSWSDRQVWIPNADWFKPEHARWADAFRVVVAKSREGERVLREAGVQRVVYAGFESEDRNISYVKRERVFFHSWAGSIMKGTRQVLRSWGIGAAGSYPCSFHVDRRVPEADYRDDMNRCLFHLQPSAVEGFGHVIHESLSVGAILATVDGPPMNEATGIAFKVPARKVSRQYLADVWEARPEDIATTAEAMWALTDAEAAKLSTAARDGFLSDREAFRGRFREILEGL